MVVPIVWVPVGLCKFVHALYIFWGCFCGCGSQVWSAVFVGVVCVGVLSHTIFRTPVCINKSKKLVFQLNHNQLTSILNYSARYYISNVQLRHFHP